MTERSYNTAILRNDKGTEPELVSSRKDRKKDHSTITPLSYCYNKKQSHKQKLLINIHFLLLWLLGLLIISISWISSVVHARVLRSSSRITIILITLGISIVSSIPLVWVWLSLNTNRNPKSISWIQGHHTKRIKRCIRLYIGPVCLKDYVPMIAGYFVLPTEFHLTFSMLPLHNF